MSQPLFLYLHLPKTAGVAVRNLLAAHYREEQVRDVIGPDYLASEQSIRELDAAQKSRVGLIAGHFSYGLHKAFDRPCQYFSMLRDPVDRMVSLYYFTRSNSRHPRHAQAQRMSLADYVCSGVHPELENCQTKMISGRPECNFVAGTEPCNEQDLVRAKTHLAGHFVSVGLFEQMDLSLLMLCRAMDWKYLPARRTNVTSVRRTLSELGSSEREAILTVNHFDQQLHEYAKTLFEQQLRSLPVWSRLRHAARHWRGHAA